MTLLARRITAVRVGASLLIALSQLTAPSAAYADTIIRNPHPPKYHVELEPKFNLNYFVFQEYGGSAWGPGFRASIPIMSPGFIPTINDSAAISFGVDIMRYSGTGYYGYYYGFCNGNPNRCPGYYSGFDPAFWAVLFPVTLQWNFFLTDKWSVFGEPGITLRQAFYPDYTFCEPPYYDPRYGPCYRDRTSLYFTFYAGGRFHFSDTLALTMRVGHPNFFSIGLSIFL
jgi:hypothetical protein